MIPEEHRDFVEELLDGARRAAAARRPRRGHAEGRGAQRRRRGARARSRSRSRTARACSSTRSARRRRTSIETAHEHGVLVGALVGSKQHAERQVAHGRRRDRRPGHRGGRSLRRDQHDGARPRGRRRGRARRARCSRPAASAAGARWPRRWRSGAQGVWTGSIWLTVAEADTSPIVVEKLLAASSRDTVRSRAMTGKPARQLRTAWTDAWARGRHARPAADAVAGHAVQLRRAPHHPRAEPGAHRLPRRPDRRPDEHGAARHATSSSTWSRSGSRRPSAWRRSCTTTWARR